MELFVGKSQNISASEFNSRKFAHTDNIFGSAFNKS